MSVNLPLLSINESILAARTPIGSPPRLPVSSSRRNLRRGLAITYPEVGGLGVELIFNKSIIKPGNNVEYIKEAVDAIAVLYTKQGCDCKDNIPVHLKVSLN